VESGGIARKGGLVGAPECRVPDKAEQSRAGQSRGRPAFLHSMMLESRDANLRCDCEGWGGGI
jgi:hypothetical protein